MVRQHLDFHTVMITYYRMDTDSLVRTEKEDKNYSRLRIKKDILKKTNGAGDLVVYRCIKSIKRER